MAETAAAPPAPPSPVRPLRQQRRSKTLAKLSLSIGLIALVAIGLWWLMIRMPGESHQGSLPPLDDEQEMLAEELRTHVDRLAGELGEHNADHYEALGEALRYVEHELSAAGYAVRRQTFRMDGRDFHNVEAELQGTDRPDEIVVVGAHYDSAQGAPGANDNASGTAAMMALARRFADHPTPRSIRFVGFVNEEPPFFQSAHMGSLVYARSLEEEGRTVVAMLSLETIGYYADEDDTQAYPFPLSAFYPSKGNFIGFVSDIGSRSLLHEALSSFRSRAAFPSVGGALPGWLPGVDWSDHWSFWQAGYPAVMVTDTAPFRYPHYHTEQDTPDKLDYERMSRVVGGLQGVVTDLATD